MPRSFVFYILHATVGEGGTLDKYSQNPSVGMRQAFRITNRREEIESAVRTPANNW
jgi:hypothetical protein